MSDIQEKDKMPTPDLEPIVYHEQILDYERLYKPHEIARGILTLENESILIRRPFLWTKDGEELHDTTARMELAQVCREHGWKIVERFGRHIAIVSTS